MSSVMWTADQLHDATGLIWQKKPGPPMYYCTDFREVSLHVDPTMPYPRAFSLQTAGTETDETLLACRTVSEAFVRYVQKKAHADRHREVRTKIMELIFSEKGA